MASIGTVNNPGNGTNPLQFQAPSQVGFTSDGFIYISDGDNGLNNRIVKLNKDDFKLFQIIGGPKGNKTGFFNQPHSIFVDSIDRLWVADRLNQRIQVFDLKGKFIGEWNTCSKQTIFMWDIVLNEKMKRFFFFKFIFNFSFF